MVGIAASDLTSNPGILALIAAAFATPAIAIALPVGVLMDRFGTRLLVLVGVVVALASFALVAFASDIPLLAVATALFGTGQLMCMIGQQGAVAGRSRASLDGAFGALTSAMGVGQMIGPFAVTSLGALLARVTVFDATDAGLLVCFAFAAAATPLVARMSPPQRHRRSPARERSALRRALVPGMWRALLVSGVVLAGVDLLYVFLPAWAEQVGVSVTTVGLLLSLRAAVTVVCRFGLDHLVRWSSRTFVLTASLVAGTGGFLLLMSPHVASAVVAMVVLGIALGIPQPLTLSWVVRITPAEVRGRALGMRVTSNRLVQVVLPLAMGVVTAPIGVAGMFLACAVTLLAAAGVTAGSHRHLDGRDET